MSPLARTALVLSSVLTWLPLCVQAHMQMSTPYPLRSPLDPDVPYYDKDYDMTSPLLPDGSDFSCKHYQNDPLGYTVKATYVAGATYTMWINGTAAHSGGSCQLSLSYDNGVTFKVIKSIVGGCPLTNHYDFTIPGYAPPSDTALLSWSWFNIVGNREMYQNCARVKIVGSPSQRYRRAPGKRQTSINQLPDMFVCNVGNGCVTVEGKEVVFPDPGNDIVYGQDSVMPAPGPGYLINGAAPSSTATGAAAASTTMTTTTTSSSSSTLDPPTTTTAASSTTATLDTDSGILTITGTTSLINDTMLMTTSVTTTTTTTSTTMTTMTTLTSTTTQLALTSETLPPVSTLISNTTPTTLAQFASTTTTTVSTPSATSIAAICTPGAFTCNSPTTFSECVGTASGSSTYVYMGSVAPGMQCLNGQFVRANAGACTPSGSIFCNGANAFYMCEQGGLVDMGPVAPGTACRNGVIGLA